MYAVTVDFVVMRLTDLSGRLTRESYFVLRKKEYVMMAYESVFTASGLPGKSCLLQVQSQSCSDSKLTIILGICMLFFAQCTNFHNSSAR